MSKCFWMPCIVNNNPAAVTFSHERAIHYWFPDRCGELWTIVPADQVLRANNPTQKQDSLNQSLTPALFLIGRPEEVEVFDHNHIKVWLNDIDSKWIMLEFKDGNVFLFTEEEARSHLADDEWLEKIYAERLNSMQPKVSSKQEVLNIQTGLLENR